MNADYQVQKRRRIWLAPPINVKNQRGFKLPEEMVLTITAETIRDLLRTIK